jgi:hypothetical protein
MARVHTLIAISGALALAACAKPSFIPNTKVRDTKENRAILKIVEGYRQAMERLDAAGVLALVHPTYQDNAGTAEGSDDIDFTGLKKLLTTRFKRTTKIRYRIEYHDVETKGRDAAVDAYIDATFEYEPQGGPTRWRRLTDYNRFRLMRDGDRWLFVGGL